MKSEIEIIKEIMSKPQDKYWLLKTSKKKRKKKRWSNSKRTSIKLDSVKIQAFPNSEIRKERIEFYKSQKWLDIKRIMFHIFPRRCMKCKCSNKKMQVDHVKPSSLYTQLIDNIYNFQILCIDCNTLKSNESVDDFRRSEEKRKIIDYVNKNKRVLVIHDIKHSLSDYKNAGIMRDERETQMQYIARRQNAKKARLKTKKGHISGPNY